MLWVLIGAGSTFGQSGTTAAAQTNSFEFGIKIADLEISPGLKFGGLRFTCSAARFHLESVVCTQARLIATSSPLGPLTLRGTLSWESSGRWKMRGSGLIDDNKALRVMLSQDSAKLRVEFEAQDVPVNDALGLFETRPAALLDHVVESGLLSLSAVCEFTKSGNSSCTYMGNTRGLNIDGVSVAQALDMDFSIVSQRQDKATSLGAKIELLAGAVYIEPGFKLGSVNPGFFVELAAEPIVLGVALAWLDEDTSVRIRGANLNHPNVVSMNFSGDLRFDPAPRWLGLDFELTSSDVAEFYKTYMQPIALDTSFASLETAGGVGVRILGTNDEIDEMLLNFDRVFIDDEGRRFSLYGLDGDLLLHAGNDARDSELVWDGGSIYKIPIGAGRIGWRSSQRNLSVSSFQDVTLFDGVFRLDSFDIEDFSLSDTKIALSGTLTPITLSALTSAFSWTPLSGKLSGEIPRLSYASSRVELDGDLKVKVFDGQIVVRDLILDKMFSTVPVLSANIAVEQLSLEELTRTFSFGNISGRLDGAIDGLVLQAWRPIRFDALFATPPDDETPHRISRQAVDNLGRLGAGTGSALSQGWLGLIPSYSYGRLGIGCRLADGHCLMNGVEEAREGSFYILTRGGILPPWIDVKGSGRRIKWQTLVDGIKQISSGEFELDIGPGGIQ